MEDINKVKEKWGKIVLDIKNNIIEDEYQKLTTEEKLCLYAEYHTKNEVLMGSTLSGLGVGSCSIGTHIPPKTTLPISLKILTGLSLNNDFKKVYIINSPRYTTKSGRDISVGDIEFSKPINKNLPDFENVMDNTIYECTLEYLNKQTDKMIYIYNLVQRVIIIEDVSNGGSTLRWTCRLTIL